MGRNNSSRFWMVYGDGQGCPTVKHSTSVEAEIEARRLASRNPGIDFYVLETVSRARKVDVEFERFSSTSVDDLPF